MAYPGVSDSQSNLHRNRFLVEPHLITAADSVNMCRHEGKCREREEGVGVFCLQPIRLRRFSRPFTGKGKEIVVERV